jgi:hypothetical protein
MKPLDDSQHVLLDAIQGLSLAAAHCARLAEDNNDPEQQYLTLIRVCDSLYTIHKLLIALAKDAGGKALMADAPWAEPTLVYTPREHGREPRAASFAKPSRAPAEAMS